MALLAAIPTGRDHLRVQDRGEPRRAQLRYSWEPQFDGDVSPGTDNILLKAPEHGSGTVYIDLLTYNGIMDYRQQHVPGSDPWIRPRRDPALFPMPETVTEGEMAGLRLIERRLHDEARGTVLVTADLVHELAREVSQWRVERNPDGTVRGRPIVRHPGFYTELGLEDVDGPRDVCRLMKRLAAAHANCGDQGLRRQIASDYLLLSDHIHDQGMTVGAGFPWGWYDGRDLATATFLMRDVLRESGRLGRDGDYFDGNYGFSRVFDDGTVRPDMDYFHNDMPNIVRCAVMQASTEEQVQCLRAVQRRLTMDILYEGRDGFRPADRLRREGADRNR